MMASYQQGSLLREYMVALESVQGFVPPETPAQQLAE